MHNANPIHRVAIIGFGEAGGIFAEDLVANALDVRVFDISFNSKKHRQPMLTKAQACGITAAHSLKDCLTNTELVISAVTASSALDVAKKAGLILAPGQLFLDINSVSPATKRKAAGYIARKGTRFIEAAVMSAVPKKRLQVPMLLGGPHAFESVEPLQRIGMNVSPLSDQLGIASAVKMCRSVVIKGLEALAIESLFAARSYGAEDKVLESLAATFPGMGWENHLPDYLISRVALHGLRRAAEMQEAANTLTHVGIEPVMALATAHRQKQLVGLMARRKLTLESSEKFAWRSVSDGVARPRRRIKSGK